MKQYLIILLASCLIITVFSSATKSQNILEGEHLLKPERKDGKIENIINIEMTPSEYRLMQQITGQKIALKPINLTINGDTLKYKQIHTRGQTTLQFKRKSIGFKLKSEATFYHAGKPERLKNFDLLNLSMDKYYLRNRLAFGMMQKAGLFNLFYSYCDLRINGKSEGIFMIVELPEDWAINKQKSPLMIRRGYNHKMDKIKTDKNVAKSEIKKYENSFGSIYKSIYKYEGEELYKVLSDVMDIDNYMKWLAFNYLVKNGDYSDEVFFYIAPEISKFRIIPWDYDDITAIAPHEGKARKNIGDKLIFSTEDVLDAKIATDEFLYEKYLMAMKELLKAIPDEVIKETIDSTFYELYPYYSENEIISQSQYDLYKDANLINLNRELISMYYWLINSRNKILENLGN